MTVGFTTTAAGAVTVTVALTVSPTEQAFDTVKCRMTTLSRAPGARVGAVHVGFGTVLLLNVPPPTAGVVDHANVGLVVPVLLAESSTA